MAPITTPEQVLATTGKTVTEAQIATAEGVIAAVTGVDFSVDFTATPAPYRARDVRHLRAAVEWQARYMLGVDADQAIDRAGNLTSASVNGVSASWSGEGSSGAIVAPLAAMALRRLSWRKSGSVRMVAGRPTPALREPLTLPQTLTSDGSDSSWKPLR